MRPGLQLVFFLGIFIFPSLAYGEHARYRFVEPELLPDSQEQEVYIKEEIQSSPLPNEIIELANPSKNKIEKHRFSKPLTPAQRALASKRLLKGFKKKTNRPRVVEEASVAPIPDVILDLLPKGPTFENERTVKENSPVEKKSVRAIVQEIESPTEKKTGTDLSKFAEAVSVSEKGFAQFLKKQERRQMPKPQEIKKPVLDLSGSYKAPHFSDPLKKNQSTLNL